MIIPDTEQVAQIIREVAAAEVMPRFRKLADHEISQKRNPGDLVTIADIESERRLTKELTRLAPGTVVVGEEGADADPSLLLALEGDRPTWLVDPVDGTANFAKGKDCFAVIVGYCQGGKTLAHTSRNLAPKLSGCRSNSRSTQQRRCSTLKEH